MEGILNYDGTSYLNLILWSQKDEPVKLDRQKLCADAVMQSGYRIPTLVAG